MLIIFFFRCFFLFFFSFIQRTDLLQGLNFLPNISLKLLMYDDVSRSIEDNARIFHSVQKFIEKPNDLAKILIL